LIDVMFVKIMVQTGPSPPQESVSIEFLYVLLFNIYYRCFGILVIVLKHLIMWMLKIFVLVKMVERD